MSRHSATFSSIVKGEAEDPVCLAAPLCVHWAVFSECLNNSEIHLSSAECGAVAVPDLVLSPLVINSP